jgi:FG-GAP-like repeat
VFPGVLAVGAAAASILQSYRHGKAARDVSKITAEMMCVIGLAAAALSLYDVIVGIIRSESLLHALLPGILIVEMVFMSYRVAPAAWRRGAAMVVAAALTLLAGVTIAWSARMAGAPAPAALNFAASAIPFAGANGIAVGDFNGDGNLDLAVTQYAGGKGHQVAVLLGKGDGSFQPPVFYGTGNGPYSVITADFNGDGKPDLAVSVAYENSIALLLGKGDGTFEPAKMAVVATYPHELAAGDFNHDGKLDLVINGSSDGFVSVLIGNGDGTFKHQMAYEQFSGTSPVVADFDRDGKLDVAVLGRERIGVMLGKGDGTFLDPVKYFVGHLPVAQVGADFNGDGKTDLAVVSTNVQASAGGSLSILFGNGGGGFGPPTDYRCGSQPRSIATADVNGDGKLDLVVADAASNAVSIFLGKGDGTFPDRVDVPPGGREPIFAAVGDFNHDGRADLAVANAGSNTISVLLQTAPGASSK